jgi:hypothetical protein
MQITLLLLVEYVHHALIVCSVLGQIDVYCVKMDIFSIEVRAENAHLDVCFAHNRDHVLFVRLSFY